MKPLADPQIIASVFLRKGGEGVKTKLFETLTAERQAVLLAAVQLHQKEEPVVACIHNATEWFLITTMRLIWSKADELGEMTIWQLATYEDNFEVALKRCMAEENPDDHNPKLEMDEIELVSFDGTRVTLALEPGYPYLGILNALMWLRHWTYVQRRCAGTR